MQQQQPSLPKTYIGIFEGPNIESDPFLDSLIQGDHGKRITQFGPKDGDFLKQFYDSSKEKIRVIYINVHGGLSQDQLDQDRKVLLQVYGDESVPASNVFLAIEKRRDNTLPMILYLPGCYQGGAAKDLQDMPNVTLFSFANSHHPSYTFFIRPSSIGYTKEDIQAGDPILIVKQSVLLGHNMNFAITDNMGKIYKIPKEKKGEQGEKGEVNSIQCGPRLKWLMAIRNNTDPQKPIEKRLSAAIGGQFDSVIDKCPTAWLKLFGHNQQDVKKSFHPSLTQKEARCYLLNALALMLATNGKDGQALRRKPLDPEIEQFIKYVTHAIKIPIEVDIISFLNFKLINLSDSQYTEAMDAAKRLSPVQQAAFSSFSIEGKGLSMLKPQSFLTLISNAENLEPDRIEALGSLQYVLSETSFAKLVDCAKDLTPNKIEALGSLKYIIPDDSFAKLVDCAKDLIPDQIHALGSLQKVLPDDSFAKLVDCAKDLIPDQIEALGSLHNALPENHFAKLVDCAKDLTPNKIEALGFLKYIIPEDYFAKLVDCAKDLTPDQIKALGFLKYKIPQNSWLKLVVGAKGLTPNKIAKLVDCAKDLMPDQIEALCSLKNVLLEDSFAKLVDCAKGLTPDQIKALDSLKYKFIGMNNALSEDDFKIVVQHAMDEKLKPDGITQLGQHTIALLRPQPQQVVMKP